MIHRTARVNSKQLILFAISILLIAVAVWVYQKQVYYVELPVVFEKSGTPCIQMTIDNKSFPVIVDTGSASELKLDPILFKNYLRPTGKKLKWITAKGIISERHSYTLPNLSLGGKKFENLIVSEMTQKDFEDSIVYEQEDIKTNSVNPVGLIGRSLLKRVNLFLDLSNSKIILTNDSNRIKKYGYDLNTFNKVPFELSKIGMLVKVKTEIGDLSLILDTASTWTLIRSEFQPKGVRLDQEFNLSKFVTKEFLINGLDYGENALYFFPISEHLRGFDGILGMDFIKKYVMFIDFEKKVLYLKRV